MTQREAIERLQDLHDKVVDTYRADYGYVGYEETRTLINRIYDGIPQWISVKDRLPEDNKDVLVYRSSNIELTIGFYHRDDWWDTDGNVMENHSCVTHWMPLPQAPKED